MFPFLINFGDKGFHLRKAVEGGLSDDRVLALLNDQECQLFDKRLIFRDLFFSKLGKICFNLVSIRKLIHLNGSDMCLVFARYDDRHGK